MQYQGYNLKEITNRYNNFLSSNPKMTEIELTTLASRFSTVNNLPVASRLRFQNLIRFDKLLRQMERKYGKSTT